jgi:hypothetical protein
LWSFSACPCFSKTVGCSIEAAELGNESKAIRTQKTGRVQILPLAKPLLAHVESLPAGDDPQAPPCPALQGKTVSWLSNQFYAIAMLAYNILISLKVLDLPDQAQSWRIQTIIRHLLTLPVSVSRHARYEVAHIGVPAGWLRWWRLFVDKWLPRRKAGRPVVEVVDSTWRLEPPLPS